MYCMNCGQQLPADAKFCTNCGATCAQQEQPAQPQFAPQPPAGSIPYPPQASGMAVWPGMMVSFTPEQTALLDKGWTLCRLAVVLPIVLGILAAGQENHLLQRIAALSSLIMYCVDKSYLKQVGLRMSAWYYLAIVLCPPIYLHHRETLTGKGHAWSIAIGIIYALVMLLVLAAIIKVIQH